ncbi:MAG: hypothetical protein AAGA33_00555 [Pseudomonadota bacterium]
MEIPGSSANSVFGSSTSSQSLKLKQVFKSAPVDPGNAARPERKRGGLFGSADGFALGALRQEIRAALTERFKLAFSSVVGPYTKAAPSASEVAGEALASAEDVATTDPLNARTALRQLRDDVAAAGNAVRDLIKDDDLDDVEDAIAKISRGLDRADEDAARNTASSASFLSADSVLKQRSSIRIRTQEGDLVTLDLRRRESFSAEDVAIQANNGSFTSTDVSVSSRSRLVFSVQGDINEQELAAIQGVFEQAEAIAADFFGGDLARAFDAASGLSYDAEQLSRVSLKFREREVTRVNLAQLGAVSAQPLPRPEPGPAFVPIAAAIPGDTPPRQPVAPVPVVTDAPPETDIAAALVDASKAATAVPEEPVDDAVETADAVDSFTESLGTFLRKTLEGFIGGDEQRFFYSESFKLRMLKSVITASAPDGGERAAETAGVLIDAVSGDDRDD